MIPRYQKIVVLVLLIVSIGMATVLVRLRERAHDRLLKGEDVAPTTAPAVAPAEPATLLIANDMDGGMVTETQSLPLPKDGEARARAHELDFGSRFAGVDGAAYFDVGAVERDRQRPVTHGAARGVDAERRAARRARCSALGVR